MTETRKPGLFGRLATRLASSTAGLRGQLSGLAAYGPIDEGFWEALEETLDLLSTPGALDEIRAAEAEITHGEAIGADELQLFPFRISESGCRVRIACLRVRSHASCRNPRPRT